MLIKQKADCIELAIGFLFIPEQSATQNAVADLVYAHLVDGVFQCFARTEFRYLGFFDFDGFACTWVTASAGGAGRNSKCTETDQCHCTAFFQLLFNGSDNSIK